MESIRKIAALAVVTCLFLTGASPAAAALLQMRAYLNGAQVPTPSGQTGIGTVTFDTTTKQLSWSVTFSGLTGAFTDAHFHGPAAAGTDGAIVVPMTGTTSPLTGSATLNPMQEAQLLAGQWYINIHSATYPSGEIRGQVRRVLGDFDGNGKADLLWRHETAGTVFSWLMNGTSISSTGSPASVADAGWQVAGRGDFDGDGKADLLWTHTDGTVYVWLMNGNAIAGAGAAASLGSNSGWVVQGVGDFDGDGKADVLWRNASTGVTLVWLMNGLSITGAGSPATVSDGDWQVQGVGDFNGDGKDDVLWVHADGSTLVWLMNGASIGSVGAPASLGANSGWEVRGVGDFDGNGKADILWKHATTGTVLIWLMNGSAVAGTGSPATVGDETGWLVQGIGDFDGDGRADILWRHRVTGATYAWLMNGTSIGTAGSPAYVADLLWTAQARGANRWAGLVGAQNAANIFIQTVNANGANLAASHLAPLLSAGYLDQGFNATEGAGALASDMRGLAFSSLAIDQQIRFDAVNQAIFVTATGTGTAPGPTPFVTQVTEDKGGLGFRRQSDGTWKMYGDQRPGEMGVQVEMRTDSFASGTIGPRQHINVDVRTRQNIFSAVTVSGGGFSNTGVPKSGAVDVVTVQADPSPAAPLTYLRDTWFNGMDSALAAATTFTVALTPASGPVATRKILSNAITTQAVTVTSPTLHTLAAANLGATLNVSWTLPAFAISEINLGGYVATSISPNPGFQCVVNDAKLGTSATSGQIVLPSLCNGQPILEAAINVSVDGAGGERTIHIYGFQ